MAGLEIAVTCLSDAQRTEEGGADSVEVCAGLSVGGLTPSWEVVAAILKSIRIGVHVIVRPHAASFHYSADDIVAILRDAARFGAMGVKSVVFGAWDDDRRLDLELIQRVQAAALPAAVTVHRALDASAEPERSLKALARLGVGRVLTAGPAATAWEGRFGLANWIAGYQQHFRFVVSGDCRWSTWPN